VEFLNLNAGGIQAIFSTLIFIVTTAYVIISMKMLKEMKIQRKKLEEPNLVYYINNIGYRIYGIIENIGNGVAYNIKTEINPKESIEEKEILKTIEYFSYLAPKQSISFSLGFIAINGHLNFKKHKMILKWSKTKDGKSESKCICTINQNHLKCLIKNSELHEMTSELSEIKRAIKDIKLND